MTLPSNTRDEALEIEVIQCIVSVLRDSLREPCWKDVRSGRSENELWVDVTYKGETRIYAIKVEDVLASDARSLKSKPEQENENG